MVFFTDRDLGALFPRVLSEAGLSVETHGAHFPHDTPDVEWLPAVGRDGWFVLSKDKRIRYRPNEQAAVMRAGIGLFLVVGTVSHETLARNFVNSVARVERFARKQARPFIAKGVPPTTATTAPLGAESWESRALAVVRTVAGPVTRRDSSVSWLSSYGRCRRRSSSTAADTGRSDATSTGRLQPVGLPPSHRARPSVTSRRVQARSGPRSIGAMVAIERPRSVTTICAPACTCLR